MYAAKIANSRFAGSTDIPCGPAPESSAARIATARAIRLVCDQEDECTREIRLEMEGNPGKALAEMTLLSWESTREMMVFWLSSHEQKRGFGSILLLHALESFAQSDFNVILIYSAASAVGFYEKFFAHNGSRLTELGLVQARKERDFSVLKMTGAS